MTYRITQTEDLLDVINAVVGTMRKKYPSINANEIYDHLIIAAGAMGADLARHEPDPMECAEKYGKALTGNVTRMLERFGIR